MKRDQYKTEFVGWENAIKAQCDLSVKKLIDLDGHGVSHVADPSSFKGVFGKLERLDLRSNLFSSWESFACLEHIPTLKTLDLSHNLLKKVENPEVLKNAFTNLTHIILNNVPEAWASVLSLAEA